MTAENMTRPEDRYAFLSTFDTIFLIDDSSSMWGRSWQEVDSLLRRITPICTEHDSDGIDVYFLNHKNNADESRGYKEIKSPGQVESLFSSVRPSGQTPTGSRIRQILKPYLQEYGARIKAGADPDETGLKPVNMIVITDGMASDDPESAVADLARQLDNLEAPSYQVGIQFFQIGNDRDATLALQDLDDDNRSGILTASTCRISHLCKIIINNNLDAQESLQLCLSSFVR